MYNFVAAIFIRYEVAKEQMYYRVNEGNIKMSICIIKHDAMKAFISALYGGNCRASRSGRFIPGYKTSGTHWFYCPKADQDLVNRKCKT
jgi:hypothetical protein